MPEAVLTFSALELCDRGEYETAAELAGLRVGEWPENVSGGILTHAERLLVAGVITSHLGGIQQTGNQDIAREMLLESIELFGEDPRSWIARSWLGWAEYWAGRFDDALITAGNVLEAEIGPETRFMILLLRSAVYWHRGLTGEAWTELQQMEPLYDQCPSLMKGKFHNQRAVILRKLGETDRAILEYTSAKEFFKGHVRWQSIAVNNLAGVYLEAKQFSEAHRYVEQARELFEQIGDKTDLARALDQTALIYLAEGKLDDADEAIQRAISLAIGETLRECQETAEKIKHLRVIQLQNDRYNPTVPHKTPRSAPDPKPIAPTPGERSTAMTPLECASSLIENEPEKASILYDLFTWATSPRGDPQHEAAIDSIDRMLYAKTDDSERHRDSYRRSRLIHEVTSDP